MMAGRTKDYFKFMQCCLMDRCCLGCSLRQGMIVVSYSFIIVGVILIMFYGHSFAMCGYYSLTGDDQVATRPIMGPEDFQTTINEKVAGGAFLAYWITGLLVVGVMADAVLLYAAKKRRSRLVRLWAAVMAGRAVGLLSAALPLWMACARGGRGCWTIRLAAVFSLSGAGLYVYVIMAAYSFAVQIQLRQGMSSRGISYGEIV